MAATPKRASLPKDWPAAGVDLDKALRLLHLPRQVGAHPVDGGMIVAGIGRYGPYVQHDGAFANLASTDEAFDVGINRAVALLAEKRAGRGEGRRGRSAEPLKAVGEHPGSGAAIRVLAGRYGPYVTDGSVNANVPNGVDPSTVTLDQAVALLEARAAATGGRSQQARKTTGGKLRGTKPAARKGTRKTVKSPRRKAPS